MKKLQQFLAATLSVCMLFAVSCDGSDKDEGSGENITVNVSKDYENGIHEVSYTQTNEYLVKDRESDYSILIPANAGLELETAASELKNLFLQATTVALPIVKDNAVSEYSNDKQFISLGNTAYAQEVGVTATEDLSRQGYLIKTIGKSIFINANTEVGVTFGVYGFLALQFNFDCFSDTLSTIDEQDTAFLFDYSVREVPDFKLRENASAFTLDQTTMRRMGFVEGTENVAGSNSVHTVFDYVSPDEWGTSHSKWFNETKTQLCYTANGDEVERAAMLEQAAKVAIGNLIAEPESYQIKFGQMDKSVWCGCDACTASYLKYNSHCAVQIQFINDMAELIEAWMETEEGKPHARDFDIICLAYHLTIDAPVRYDEALGKYVPVDESVIPGEHTLIMYAPSKMDLQHDIYDECNDVFETQLYQWQAVAPRLAVYNYFQNYTSFWLYMDSYSSIKNLYQLYAQCNVENFYEEAQGSYNAGGTAWAVLRNYISSKLAWNVNLDLEELTKKFFENYFDEASEEMYETFLLTRMQARLNSDVCCTAPNSFYAPINNADCWSKEFALQALANIEKALSDIGYLLKTNPSRYEIIYNHIVSERISYAYILIEFYGTHLSESELLALKQQTKQDAETNGIRQFGNKPKTTAAEIWERWGV